MRNYIAMFFSLVLACSCQSITVPSAESTKYAESGPHLDLRGAEFHVDRRSGDGDDALALGISLDHGSLDKNGMWGLDYGLLYSRLDHIAIDRSSLEAHVGLLFTPFVESRVRPYLGAGLGFITVGLEVDGRASDLANDWKYAFLDIDDRANSFGGYARAGLAIDVGENTEIGIEARSLFGTDLDIGGVPIDGDYTQFGIWMGYRF